MSLPRKLLNGLWLFSQRGDHNYFIKNLYNVQGTQSSILLHNLRKNEDSEYGRHFGFHLIKEYKHFADTVPIIEEYASLQNSIEKMAQGQGRILTNEKLLFFESTSGTTSYSKWIPYTASLKREFQKAIAVWMVETEKSYPKAFHGASFWSISPPLKKREKTTGGVQIGMNADTDYFNPIVGFLLSKIMAIPPNPSSVHSAHEFYLHVCRYLLACEDLSFVSIWSPNYLLQLQNFMLENLEEILASNISRRRSDFILANKDHIQWEILFPKLSLVSCWSSAQSQMWIPHLQNILGRIPIQPKGLLSTEGVVTIPLHNNCQGLAFTSHFYEFKKMDSARIFLSSELENGEMYEVIITTGGGLYRYNTKDMVRSMGYFCELPLLEFMGKSEKVSDLVGEKVHEWMVTEIFNNIIHQLEPVGTSLFLYPTTSKNSIQYNVFVETENTVNLATIEQQVEKQLSNNPYYLQARTMGQINPVKAFRVHLNFHHKLFEYYKKNRMLRDGDVKLPLLLAKDSLEFFLWNNYELKI